MAVKSLKSSYMELNKAIFLETLTIGFNPNLPGLILIL